jgi:hypothetical protein
LRSDIFILGVMMVVIGPVLTAAAASSCLLTILNGNVFACANDLPVFIGGGALFITGIITSLIGVIAPEPQPRPRNPTDINTPTNPTTGGASKKCGRANTFGLLSCPFCGQTAG